MLRARLVTAVLGAIVAVASSARPSWGQQTAAKPELLISLSVAPAPAPQPALKYLLIPELREMNPGNPIQGYFKCYLGQYRFVFDDENFDRRQILLAMPLEELPALMGQSWADPRSLRSTPRPGWIAPIGRSCSN